MHTHPETAIILGTGLGSLVHEITDKYEINYSEIPNFPVSTVEGHSGKLIFGKLGNKDIMAMQGRFHFYEGYSMKEVTFPVRVMRELGIKTLFVSNAAGGTNPDFEIGDLMIITDHINLFPEHPLRGKNIEYGPRFPDMSEAYSKELIAKALEIAQENLEAVMSVLQFIYDNIMYAELNTKSDYCQVCGYDGEIKIVEDDGKLVWECPKCGNRDQNKLNVARRTCGYIGTQFWNQGRTQEIKDRVLHL